MDSLDVMNDRRNGRIEEKAGEEAKRRGGKGGEEEEEEDGNKGDRTLPQIIYLGDGCDPYYLIIYKVSYDYGYDYGYDCC